VPDSADLVFLLSQAAHALTTELTAELAEIGITPREHCVLTHALSGTLTQIQVAERCALDKTTMVVTLDGLEQRGLAERRPSPTDRRARIVVVTPEGEALAARADEVVARIYESVLDSLPADQCEGFVAGLQALVAGRLANPPACQKPVRRPRAG
jgi:MarR family transcriptional regulator for hemolysin